MLPLVRTNSDDLCSSGSSFSKIQYLFYIQAFVTPPACSFISCLFGSIFKDVICKCWRLKGHCGVKKLQVCGRFFLVSPQPGTPHGCFTQPNINDLLREEFQPGGTDISPRNTPCHVPARHPLLSCLQPQAFKSNKKERENWEGWKTHL